MALGSIVLLYIHLEDSIGLVVDEAWQVKEARPGHTTCARLPDLRDKDSFVFVVSQGALSPCSAKSSHDLTRINMSCQQRDKSL